LVALAAAHNINDAFGAVLNGEQAISNDQIEAMWMHYSENEGKSSPNAELPEAERMANFRASMWRVIQHNSQEGMTW
jgi:hypothetical protein